MELKQIQVQILAQPLSKWVTLDESFYFPKYL